MQKGILTIFDWVALYRAMSSLLGRRSRIGQDSLTQRSCVVVGSFDSAGFFAREKTCSAQDDKLYDND
jgi:hypothetical protein